MSNLFKNWRDGENSSTIFFMFYFICSCCCFLCNRLGNKVDSYSMRSPKGTLIATYFTFICIIFLLLCLYHCVIEPWKKSINDAFRCSFVKYKCEKDQKCITDQNICNDGDIHRFKSCKIKKCTMTRDDCIGVVPPPIKDPELQFYRLVDKNNNKPIGGNLIEPPSINNQKEVYIITSCDKPPEPKKQEIKCGNRKIYI
jgi:hypothetical protein